jgi:hypothetical protein
MTDTCDFCSPKASDTCDACGKTQGGIAWFAAGFRKLWLKQGKPDPGNLCGSCAGAITGREIGGKVP